MRKPEPWYWETRKGWYVQIRGKQILLAKAPKSKSPPVAVQQEYYRLMATEGFLTERERRKATVAEVAEVYLEAKSRLRASTLHNYTLYLRRLAAEYMTKPISSLGSADIVKVAEAQNWNPSTKKAFVQQACALLRWARDKGYLEMNPVAGWANPYTARRRTRILSDADFTAILDAAMDLEFRQVMMFLRGTGCRPGEARQITAAHVHPTRPLVVLTPDEHKTGRTGRERILVMPAEVDVMVRSLCRQHPTGLLFRNSRFPGKGWCRSALTVRFRRYRRKLGLPEDTVPYLIRHSTLSRLLDGGTDVHLAAKIAGHADVKTLMDTYYHPDVDRMAAALDESHSFKGKKGRGS